MISEKEFAEGFTGFWAQCLPFLTPQLIAKFNLSGSPMPDSNGFVVKPLRATSDSSNNDIMAETAFGIFATAHQRRTGIFSIVRDEKAMSVIISAAIRRIVRLRGLPEYEESQLSLPVADAIELAVRLDSFFDTKSPKTFVIQPRLKGCGILDSCYADLLGDDCIYEVKMVDRNLRSVDLRQVLTYCALNYQSRQYAIQTASILNPRRGIEFHFDLEALAQQAAGKNSAELFHQIIDFLGNFEAIHQAS